jgi:hypothetical protein
MADASAVPNNLTPNISRREARVDLDALHALGYATDTEVCKLFGWTDRQLWENRRDPQRRIPYVPFGRLCLYKIADVQRHLEGLTVQPEKERKQTLGDLALAHVKKVHRARKTKR